MTTWNDIAQSNDARAEARAIAEREANETGFEEAAAPSPVGTPASETERARKDAAALGIGFVHKGVRLDPADVVVHRRFDLPDAMTTGELWKQLEQVLVDKGASPEWIEYALPDLQIAASQYASSVWGAGHRAGAAGEPMPNPPETRYARVRTIGAEELVPDEYTEGVEPMPTVEDDSDVPDHDRTAVGTIVYKPDQQDAGYGEGGR